MDTFYVIKDSTLKGFADVTRSLTGEEKTYTTAEMIDALNNASGLNFSIVSYPTEEALLNTTPNENTIGVVTDVEIPEWYFAPENPYIRTSEDLYTDVGGKSGYYLSETGVETTSTSYKMLTDNIMLPDGTTEVTIIASSTETTLACHGFYDAKGELISTAFRKAGTVKYTVPAGTKSVRISIRSDDPGSLIATYTDTATKEGTLWIYVGDYSPAEFNALKKNHFQLCPLYVKQYISGTWIERTSKSYISDEWIDWVIFMYKNGELNSAYNHTEKKTPSSATITYEADHIYLATVGGSISEVYKVFGPVDLTKITKLTMNGTFIKKSTETFTNVACLFIASTANVSYKNAAAIKSLVTSGVLDANYEYTLELDVSNLSGEYYIYGGTNTQGSAWSSQRQNTINYIQGIFS